MEVKEEIKGIEKEERVTWGGIRRKKITIYGWRIIKIPQA